MGSLKYFLGLEIARSKSGIDLCQCKYALSLLEDTGFLGAKPASAPMDPNVKLSATEGEPLLDNTQYRTLIGHLLYLTISRPNLAYPVNCLSQFVSQPWLPHLHAAYYLLCYLKCTPGQGLLFSSQFTVQL